MNGCSAHCTCSPQAVSLSSPSLPQVNDRIRSTQQNSPRDLLCAWPCPGHWRHRHRVDATHGAHSPVGDRWAKRHPGNKVRDAERDVWWAGSEYLPSTTEPALGRVLLPTAQTMPEAPPPHLPVLFARWQRAHPEAWASHDCPSPLSRHLSSQPPLQVGEAM